MPLSKTHKEQSYEKILSSAIRLFTSRGYDAVSINELMKESGLTRGAFYTHFESKQAIYAEAIVEGAKRSLASKLEPNELDKLHRLIFLINGYLSREHVKEEVSPCPLAFLVTDIANNETQVKSAYTKVFKGLNSSIYREVKRSKTELNENIIKSDIYAATSMMVGSVAIARALNDDDLSEKLLLASRKQVFLLLGIDVKE